jgi:hypothetical protein
MTVFKITDPIAAGEIGTWCNEHLKESDWGLDVQGLFSNQVAYKFKLFNQKDAVVFGLKWADFA